MNKPEKHNIIQLTAGADVVAPEILPYEIGNALSAMYKRRQITKPGDTSVSFELLMNRVENWQKLLSSPSNG